MCPRYDYECQKCGVFETFHGMSEPSLKKCPTCKRKVDRVFSTQVSFLPPKDSGWEMENGGRGRFIAQIANDVNDPGAYCRSRAEIIEKGKQRGFTKFEKC